MGAIGAGARTVCGGGGVGVKVDHEVCLLPAIFLERPAQLLMGPDELQHLTGTSHLPI